MKPIDRFSVLLHCLGWMLFILFPFLLFPFQLVDQAILLIILRIKLLNDLLLIGLFYSNLYVLTPTLLRRSNKRNFSLILILVLGLVMLIDWILYQHYLKERLKTQLEDLFAKTGVPVYGQLNMNFLVIPNLVETLLSFVFVVLISSLNALIAERSRTHQERQQAVLDKLTAELVLLKMQISPHFLFNTLNNISWLARKRSRKTEKAVVELSQLLRYMIYQANKGPVPMDQEIQYLIQYINLQKMRLDSHTQVSFVYQGELGQYTIEPLLLIVFVENAFKYGVHSFYKSGIDLGVVVQENTLHFYTENALFSDVNRPSCAESGIGLQNTRRRLQLHYPDRHNLSITAHNAVYRVDLQINLLP